MALITEALSNVGNVEDYLGITATATQRDAIERVVNGITMAMENYTGRKLFARNYTPALTPEDSILDGNGRNYLYVPQSPVNSMTLVELGLTTYRHILRTAIAAVTGTTLTSGGGFTFNAQDVEIGRGIVSIAPNNSTETTEATITSIAGAVATMAAGWSNGIPVAIVDEWWFAEGYYLQGQPGADVNQLILSNDIFIAGNQNVRLTYNAGYTVAMSEYALLSQICTSLSGFIFRQGPHSGMASETMGQYSYRLGDVAFKNYWDVNDLSALDQFRNWRTFM